MADQWKVAHGLSNRAILMALNDPIPDFKFRPFFHTEYLGNR